MDKILITGFEPFGGEHMNPSWEAVKRLPDTIGRFELIKLQLPVVFGTAAEVVLEEARKIRPDVILCTGQAGGRAGVTVETAALNLRDASMQDNAGNQPSDQCISKTGPAAYFTTVPVKKMVNAIKDSGIAASVSYSAGVYVCNDLLYSLLHHYDGTDTKVGFIHVPYAQEQAKDGVPSMSLEDMTRALTVAIHEL